MTYQIAEKFKSIQGEGVYAGTPMAFIRFVGCSVGKRICQHCDTDFDKTYPWRGGGEFSSKELTEWAFPYEHICLTGGEPLNQDLTDLAITLDWYASNEGRPSPMLHVETSGTVLWTRLPIERIWVCVSPKPGFRDDMIDLADEVKVIVPGLGDKLPDWIKTGARDPIGGYEVIAPAPADNWRWPDISDALCWAKNGKTVFLQPRNGKFDIDKNNLMIVQDIIRDNPTLRLSVQMHKVLHVQ